MKRYLVSLVCRTASIVVFALTLVLCLALFAGCHGARGKSKGLIQNGVVSISGFTGSLSFNTNGSLSVTGVADRVSLVGSERRDANAIATVGMFTSDKVSQFSHTRSNSLGAFSQTTIGEMTSKPDAEAITATGGAAGNLVGAATRTISGLPSASALAPGASQPTPVVTNAVPNR